MALDWLARLDMNIVHSWSFPVLLSSFVLCWELGGRLGVGSWESVGGWEEEGRLRAVNVFGGPALTSHNHRYLHIHK